jgi:hypothetical protein
MRTVNPPGPDLAAPFERPDWLLRLNAVGRDLAPPGGRLVPLEAESLLTAATEATGLDDFGPEDFREPLDILVDSLVHEADASLVGNLLARGDLLNLLENRLRMVAARSEDPEIGAEQICSPIFIVGLPRSGTSILHELLARDARLRAPLSWEAHSPCPPRDAEPGWEQARIERAENVFTFWNQLVPAYATMHEMGARIPCECIWLTAHSFRSEEFLGRNRVPRYGAWLAGADLAPAYAIHREILQLLQRQKPTERWLLKAPSHMVALPALFDRYPDARIVQTHRDPLQIMGSSVNLLRALCWMRSETVDPDLIKASFAGEGLAARLFAALDYRDSPGAPSHAFRDVRFSDLMTDPLGVVAEIYADLALPLTREVEAAMGDYLAAKPRHKFGKHDYRFGDLGLDLAQERERFAGYQERFGIASEVE